MRSRPTMGRLLLGSTALAAVLAIAPAAVAQDAEGTAAGDGETVVVVTGIRNSLQTAAQVKRRADTFVDSITASDVSTLPDLSVAEALQRVPGVTMSRFSIGGFGSSPDFPKPEGSGNLIRGLGFVRSEFNGRDAFSANRGRSLDWSSIPPELVGGVDVYKNSSADLIEGGISGTINLRTLEPFDRRGYFAAFSADANYGDLAKKWSPSYSAIISNRWQTSAGEFGLMASYSTSNLKSDVHGWQQGSPIPRTDINIAEGRSYTADERAELEAAAGADTPAKAAAFWANQLPGQTLLPVVGIIPSYQLRTNEFDRDRSSFYLAGQWRNDTTRVTLKYIRVENQSVALERTMESFAGYNTGANTNFGRGNILPPAPLQVGGPVVWGDDDTVYGDLGRITIDPTWQGSVPLCNVRGDGGINVCENDAIPLTGGLMTSGWFTNSNDNWAGGFGDGETSLLGIGRHEKALTEDMSANVKWRPGDKWFIELDAQHTKATSEYREHWGGAGIPSAFYVDHDLDHPRIQVALDPRMGVVSTPSTRDPNSGYARPTTMADPYAAYFKYANEVLQDGEGKLSALRADATYTFDEGNWFKAVRFGARVSEREQINQEADQNWAGTGTPWSGGYGWFGDFSTKAHDVIDFSDFYRGGVVGGANQRFIGVAADLLLSPAGLTNFIANEPNFASGVDWNSRLNADGTVNYPDAGLSEITEKTTNAYIRFDFGQEFSNGMSVDGNFGVRYSTTKLDSQGFLSFREMDADNTEDQFQNGRRTRTEEAESRDNPRDFLPETVAYLEQDDVARRVQREDTHWLPSFNMKWNLNDEMLIRFGASSNVSRPNIGDMRAYQQVREGVRRVSFPPITDVNDPLYGVYRGEQSIDLQALQISGGNASLKPTTANSYDLSYEWYFAGGSLSAAVFKKDIKDSIIYGSTPYGALTGDSSFDAVELDGYTVGAVYTGQINQDEVNLQGIELAYQQFYDFLPGWMSNLGVQTNYTWVDASASPPGINDLDGDGIDLDPNNTLRWGVNNLLGQSEHIFNFVGIYQDGKNELRFAYNWRSEYLTTYRDYVTGNPIFASAAGFLDASYKYDVNENLQLRVSASNLLDTKNKATSQINETGQRYDRFSFLNDRRFVFGFRYQH